MSQANWVKQGFNNLIYISMMKKWHPQTGQVWARFCAFRMNKLVLQPWHVQGLLFFPGAIPRGASIWLQMKMNTPLLASAVSSLTDQRNWAVNIEAGARAATEELWAEIGDPDGKIIWAKGTVKEEKAKCSRKRQQWLSDWARQALTPYKNTVDLSW